MWDRINYIAGGGSMIIHQFRNGYTEEVSIFSGGAVLPVNMSYSVEKCW